MKQHNFVNNFSLLLKAEYENESGKQSFETVSKGEPTTFERKDLRVNLRQVSVKVELPEHPTVWRF